MLLKMDGLKKNGNIDNDYDMFFANKLSQHLSKKLSIVPYDFSSDGVLDHFNLLKDLLGCDYCLGMGYFGYCSSSRDAGAIINGQNADSILSFGGMGWPRWNGFKLSGLQGLFTRYFQFYGEQSRFSFMKLFAQFLRKIYYFRNYRNDNVKFTRKNYFIGIGLNPENRYYFPSDPAYKNIDNPDEVASWFEDEYIEPVLKKYEGLSDHAISIILYNKTYMQASANRASVISAIENRVPVFLPYTALNILEQSTCIKPNWKFMYYGKFPNVEIGRRKLSLPNFIIDRQDPYNSDSSMLIYEALFRNNRFKNYISEVIKNADLVRYKGILSEGFIKEIESQQFSLKESNFGNTLRFAWIESILQKHNLD